MIRRNILSSICLALAAIAFVGGATLVRAQTEEPKQSQPNTANFRDPANVPKLRSTTNAQREDAARRAAEYRAEAARSGVHKNTTSTPSTAPIKATGGANE